MMLPNFYLPFITWSNGRYSLVTSESHKNYFVHELETLCGCYVGRVTMSPLKCSQLLQRKEKFLTGQCPVERTNKKG